MISIFIGGVKRRRKNTIQKLSGSYKKGGFSSSDQPSIIEGAYEDINKAVSLIMSEFKLVS